jgi:hypothetical protein
MKDRTQNKKSLGALRKAKKTKERSPDLLGQLHLQRYALLEIVRQTKETNSDEVVQPSSVEKSPWYTPRVHHSLFKQ